jgi:hypothetical protein
VLDIVAENFPEKKGLLGLVEKYPEKNYLVDTLNYFVKELYKLDVPEGEEEDAKPEDAAENLKDTIRSSLSGAKKPKRPTPA